jgi:hypothetical protein
VLKIYDKLDDVPEALREHYRKSGDRFVPEVSDDHPLVTQKATLLNEKKAADDKATKLEADLQSARAGNLPRGQRAVPAADAELIERVKAGGVTKPEEFDALKTEHAGFKAKAEQADAAAHAAQIGEAMKWDREKTARLVPKVFDLSQVEIRDGKDGKKELIARVKQADGSAVEKPFADVVKATPELSDLLPALAATPGSRDFITQGGGSAPGAGDAVEHERRRLVATGRYAL